MNDLVVISAAFLFGLGLLYYGANGLVLGGRAIAARTCVSPLVIGLTLVAFGTSAPELFVSVGAAMSGLGDICVGNVVGSNICNVALILGLAAWFAPMKVNPVLLRRDMPAMLLAAVAVSLLCCLSGGFGRLAGALFLVALAAYTVVGIRMSSEACEVVSDDVPTKGIAWLLVVGGLLALVGGAKLVLGSAVAIERIMGVPDEVVALTVVAVGTSLPELATSVVAARKGEPDIAIGNIVGSNIFNVFGILGVSALVRPVAVDGMHCVDFVTMVAVTGILWLMMKGRRCVGRPEGALLLATYAAYLIARFHLQ